MKNTVFLISILFILISCGGKDDPSPSKTAQDEVTEKLTGGFWKMQNVTVDGVDQSSVYKNLSLQFSTTNYTSTNGGVVWPSSGTWTFSSTDATTIKRNDGTEVKLVVTDTSLKLTLAWASTTLGQGRVQSVKGQNVFTFTR